MELTRVEDLMDLVDPEEMDRGEDGLVSLERSIDLQDAPRSPPKEAMKEAGCTWEVGLEEAEDGRRGRGGIALYRLEEFVPVSKLADSSSSAEETK
jgi:hypothetical protein